MKIYQTIPLNLVLKSMNSKIFFPTYIFKRPLPWGQWHGLTLRTVAQPVPRGQWNGPLPWWQWHSPYLDDSGMAPYLDDSGTALTMRTVARPLPWGQWHGPYLEDSGCCYKGRQGPLCYHSRSLQDMPYKPPAASHPGTCLTGTAEAHGCPRHSSDLYIINTITINYSTNWSSTCWSFQIKSPPPHAPKVFLPVKTSFPAPEIFFPLKTSLYEKLPQGSHFLPNTKFQVFSRILVLNSRFFQGFLCQIPGTFIQILVIKISKCVKTDAGFLLLLWHKIPCISM